MEVAILAYNKLSMPYAVYGPFKNASAAIKWADANLKAEWKLIPYWQVLKVGENSKEK